jgi:hypothetical protein
VIVIESHGQSRQALALALALALAFARPVSYPGLRLLLMVWLATDTVALKALWIAELTRLVKITAMTSEVSVDIVNGYECEDSSAENHEHLKRLVQAGLEGVEDTSPLGRGTADKHLVYVRRLVVEA